MSKTQKVNKEKKKPKADKDQPKSHVCRHTRRHKARASRPLTRSRERPEAKPMTSMPSWNLTPAMTFGNWFSPFSRRQVFEAAHDAA